MAIMAMGTAEKPKNKIKTTINFILPLALLPLALLSSMAFSGEWRFEPNIGITETYSDNVLLTASKPESSLISEAIASLNTNYLSTSTKFNFLASKSYLNYRHDSTLNDAYRSLTADVEYSLWKNGPSLIATGYIDNVARNESNNGLADLISGDTIESTGYSTGLQYNVGNTGYSINSSFIFDNRTYEDNISDSSGFTGSISGLNGNSARITFWQFSANYSKREQDSFNGNSTNDGENYTIDAKIGAITPFAFNPFLRVYNEKVEGSVAGQNQQTTPSWGPGLRWQVSPHFIVDVSYNYTQDETVSDDYVDAQINWQPSSRTSLIAGYSQRFFGDSYNFDFQHRTRRLTNSISYSESLEAFDRNSFSDVDLGFYWCPLSGFLGDVSQCFPQSQPPTNISDYQLIPISGLQPVNSQEFSLQRSLVWSSKLQLSRTSFAFNINRYEREGLESGVKDDNLNASVKITRTPSPKSELSISADFKYSIYDKDNPNGARQEDYYRTLSASYTKNLASSLSSSITLRHINRNSNILRFTYDEVRIILNITKDF